MQKLLDQIVKNEIELLPDREHCLDGGTIMFSVKLADGQIRQMFLDRRLGSKTPDQFYADAYPDRQGSLRLGKNDILAGRVCDFLTHSQNESGLAS